MRPPPYSPRAAEAGAPKGIVQCLGEATIQGTNELMRHRQTGVILSTGGPGIVRAAYSSGKPALGVGPGNVAVLLEASADVDQAIASVVEGKSFDYGTVCSSEQTVVAEAGSRDRVLAALQVNRAYLCDAQQTQALEKLLVTPEFRINPDCVGQAPGKIAEWRALVFLLRHELLSSSLRVSAWSTRFRPKSFHQCWPYTSSATLRKLWTPARGS